MIEPRAPLVPYRDAVVGLLALVVFVGMWALSSPPLSTPDEKWHIANIWCAPGSQPEDCRDRSFNELTGYVEASPSYFPRHCFFRQPTIPANCADPAPFTQRAPLLQEGSYYLPGFQVAMNQLVGDDGSRSILMMKLLNGLLFVLIISAILIGATTRLARACVMSIAVTLTPLSIWLITSINPSGWGITALNGSWILTLAFLGVVQTQNYRNRSLSARLSMLAALAMSFFMALQARSDVRLLFIAVIVVIATTETLSYFHTLRSVRALSVALGVAALTVFVLGWRFGTEGILGYKLDLASRFARAGGISGWQWLSNWLTHFPAVFLDAYGASGLGENDVRIPAVVGVSSLIVLGGTFAFASQEISWKQLSSVAILAVSLVAMLWFASIEMDLYNVPGRYVMPLFPAIIGTYIYYSRTQTHFFDVIRLRRIAIVILGVNNALGLYAVVERYSAGSSAGLRVIPVRFDEWWWDFLPIGPNAVVILGSVSWVVFLVYAFRFLDERKLREAAS